MDRSAVKVALARFSHPKDLKSTGMKTLLVCSLMFGVSTPLFSQSGGAAARMAASDLGRGILKSVENGSVARTADGYTITAKTPGASIELDFSECQGVGMQQESDQWWVLPLGASGAAIDANRALWVLPLEASSKESSWHLVLRGGTLHAVESTEGMKVSVHAPSVLLSRAEARPHSDPFGRRFSLQIAGGAELEDALAAFYWGTMLPSIVEKTMAAKFPYSDGYVLSTLHVRSYAGSYPAVDHEFQIKGRLAIASDLDLDVVKRMIGLQFKLMQDDPEHLYRAPTSVQPDGRREYHIRRDSQDRRENAAMFPVTGNIEVIEESWHYYAARKDTAWLRSNIENLEHAAGWVLANTDQYGRVWSDVYYEDQVIKDGRVTQAQAFAAHAFTLLAAMENRLGRFAESARFDEAATKMKGALVAQLPMGYWDAKNQRFVDWVDRNGQVHDHLHLLANELPVVFGFASADQAAAVREFVDSHTKEFERFPSFVAADIAAYTPSEIGIAGPYDLCAAGRYWYWDGRYRQTRKENGVLLDQLRTVAAEGAQHGYFMDERYDMDHVYYVDGKDSHGAEKYYEYPNVFAAVLIGQYLGLSASADADVAVAPHLTSFGSVEFGVPQYALRYAYTEQGFTLKNLSSTTRRFEVDLSALGSATTHYRLSSKSEGANVGGHFTVTLSPQEEARWTSQE